MIYHDCGDYMPLFLPVAGRNALVVGAGTIAARRIRTLLRFGVKVIVIAPDICAELAALETEGAVTIHRRKAETVDVVPDLLLVVAASSDRVCNHMISEAAKTLGIPVSVADCKEESTFFFPAIVDGGGIVAGLISLDGGDHRLAAKQSRRLRETLKTPLEEPKQ